MSESHADGPTLPADCPKPPDLAARMPIEDAEAGAMADRDEREELTRRAMADIICARISDQKLKKSAVARASGISRTHLRSVLRAEKMASVFIMLEVSDALGSEDASRLLRDIVDRRDQLYHQQLSVPAAHPPIG